MLNVRFFPKSGLFLRGSKMVGRKRPPPESMERVGVGKLHKMKGLGSMRHNETVNRRLTIAHFMPGSGIGGVEIATLRLVEATRERFRHVAFCLDDAVSLRNSFEKLGIETVTYTPPEPSLR